MNTSDGLTSLLNRSFNGLEDNGQECIDKFNSAVHHINDWRFLLGPAMLIIRPALDEIRTNLQKMLKLIRTAVEHHLPVVSLIFQSFNWLGEVQEPVIGLTHPKNHLSSYWKGDASSAYQSKVTTQDAAVKTVAGKANDISKWLIDIAKYNVEYMTELAKMATGFVGQLVACALEAATVVEIPFAVDKLAGAIGTLVTQALDNLVGIAKRFVEVLSKVRDIVSMMIDDTLPQRSWPQAVLRVSAAPSRGGAVRARFRHAWAQSLIASTVAATALVGGCGGPPIPEMPKPVFTSATSPHGPVRYPFTAFPTCEEIRQRIPELATLSRPSRVDSPGQLSQECEYRDPADADGVPVVYLRIRLYNNIQDLSGFSSGAEVAKQLFDAARPPDAERDTDVGVGTEALWAEPDAAGNCGLGILDENAVLRLWYRSGTSEKVDPRSARCREPARVVARKLYAAVQPR